MGGSKSDEHLLCGLQVSGENHCSHLNTRGGSGPTPLEIHEQGPPVAPVISEVGKEEGTATEHYPLLLLLLWECTHSDAAIAKLSRHCPYLPEDHLSLLGACD